MILLFIVIVLAILAALLLRRMIVPIIVVAAIFCIFGVHSLDWMDNFSIQQLFVGSLIIGAVIGILLGIVKMKAKL
jgi:ABC-type proline/glycine betaine transport system permease subunit